jgi:hypothetical protein
MTQADRERDTNATREVTGAIAAACSIVLGSVLFLGCVGGRPSPQVDSDIGKATRDYCREMASVYRDAATNPKPTVSEQMASNLERLDKARSEYGEAQKRHLKPIIGSDELTPEAAKRGFLPLAEAFERAAR